MKKNNFYIDLETRIFKIFYIIKDHVTITFYNTNNRKKKR